MIDPKEASRRVLWAFDGSCSPDQWFASVDEKIVASLEQTIADPDEWFIDIRLNGVWPCGPCDLDSAKSAVEEAVRESEAKHGTDTPLTWMTMVQSDVTELVTAIASGEPVTEAHRDLARAIQERWESEVKRG